MEIKICKGCSLTKTTDQYYPKRVKKDGTVSLMARCIECQNAYRTDYYAKNPEKKAQTNRKSQLTKYGITPEYFDALFQEQEGKCAGCIVHQSELNQRISVDHCHATGLVRGLLCQKCNTILGLANDNVTVLENLINFLNKNVQMKESVSHG